MKVPYSDRGYMTSDLSECKVHQVMDKDGVMRLMAYYPATWEERGEPVMLETVRGDVISVQIYNITGWNMMELQVKE